MSSTLVWTALGFYGLAIVSSFPSVIQRRVKLSPATLMAVGAGLLSHLAGLMTAALAFDRPPLTNVSGFLSVLAFMACAAFLVGYWKYRIMPLAIFVLPVVFLLTLTSALQGDLNFSSAPFRTRWMVLHISALFVGYAALFLTFIASVMYLMQERELKSKKPWAFYHRLPSLEALDALAHRTLVVGMPFMTLGIITGFIWAGTTWEGPWGLDWKIIASVLTWLGYLAIFASRVAGRLRGRRAAYFAMAGFAALMFTFLVISYVSGVHGFFPNLEGKS